jgi:phosphoglycerol transferase MdoB-like AlkP superfamily enzyme
MFAYAGEPELQGGNYKNCYNEIILKPIIKEDSVKKQKFQSFNNFYNLVNYFFRIYLIALGTFFVYRLVFLLVYGEKADLSSNFHDVFRAFFVGLRFDTTVTLYGLLLPFILILSTLFVSPKHLAYPKFVKTFIFCFSILMFLTFIIISVIDFYFFKFFQFHINIIFFGIINDDTRAVLKSVWTDYPVIPVIIFVIISVCIYWYIIKRILRKTYDNPFNKLIFKTIIILTVLILYGIGIRGSLGTFPLENEDSIISDNTFINSLVVNGVFSIKNAFSERNKQTIDTNVVKKLKENGFNSIEEPLSIYLGKNIMHTDNPELQLLTNTRKDSFLQQNPPNVIFIQMESFGSYYLNFHTPTLNLLGKLESQLKHCILYKNFISGTYSTIQSLECLMLGSPLTPISQSIYMNCSLSSSVALPYKNAGYKTSFITSSELGWRNLDKFIPRQYFETVEGAEALLKKVDNSSRCEWGVYDEFLFERIYQILKQANKRQQFIFAMTTTNHTPFELPDDYKPYPVTIPQSICDVLRTDKDIAIKNFTNYQYANDCLGKFIERIRKSSFAENTIIAVTGDHNSFQLFSFTDNQMLQKSAVPFLLYVPEKYLAHSKIDTSLFG